MTRLPKRSAADRQQRNDESSIAEKLKIAEELRDLQERLAPLREANKTERAKSKIQIRIKTR